MSTTDEAGSRTLVSIMSKGPGRIQRQMLQILRRRRSLIDTAELALRVYGCTGLTPAQRVAAWRALDGLEARGLLTHQLRHGRCYWRAKRSF
jgi:hypothetical protein